MLERRVILRAERLRQSTQLSLVGGVPLAMETRLLVLLGSACHDESQYPEGDRFDLTQTGPQNLPFGHGVHLCLGAQLARTEGPVALEALLDRCGALARGPSPMTWQRTLVVRGPVTLPVVSRPE
ncbi:hypothetical protein BHS04_15755 [Myxococcus xanthus]|nr:hypothetical protein BHS04_15755 [Myxococcus xanthus]